MNSEITNKTYVAVVAGIGRIYLTKREANIIMAAMDSEDTKSIQVGESKFRIASIHGIAPVGEIQNLDRIKQGDFMCKNNTWHSRNEKCNCAEAMQYGLL